MTDVLGTLVLAGLGLFFGLLLIGLGIAIGDRVARRRFERARTAELLHDD